VNLILFESAEILQPLARTDRRAIHLLEILRRNVGDTFDAGVINGPRGKGTLEAITSEVLRLAFTWTVPPRASDPITLIVGLPRPQTARDILREATTLGAAALHFVRTEKSDAAYARSTLWTSGDWRRHVLAGAEQAFDTRIPDVTFNFTLPEALAALPAGSRRLALDHYEAGARMAGVTFHADAHHVLALGGERGWSAADRDALRSHQFLLVHLGPRVLRTETATIAALTILRTQLGLM
jgi:RsmE family RNA methyltransferase